MTDTPTLSTCPAIGTTARVVWTKDEDRLPRGTYACIVTSEPHKGMVWVAVFRPANPVPLARTAAVAPRAGLRLDSPYLEVAP